MLDVLISEINERFSENSYSVLTALESLLLDSFTCAEPKPEHLAEVVGYYGDEFLPEKLKSELMVLCGFVKSISPPCSCGSVGEQLPPHAIRGLKTDEIIPCSSSK